MTEKALMPLNVREAPLTGLQVIEASAGTGKTWTICELVLRWVKAGFPIQKLLVVTFTDAATAELRSRVRARLAAALKEASVRPEFSSSVRPEFSSSVRPEFSSSVRPEPVEGHPSGLDKLSPNGRGLSPSGFEAIQLALATFDEAAILTIHAYCQRVLSEIALSSGQPLELDIVDDSVLRRAWVADFWQQHVATIQDPARAAWASRFLSPEIWDAQLRRHVSRLLGKTVWPQDLDTPPLENAETVAAAFSLARSSWVSGHTEARQCLLNAIAAKVLHAGHYTQKSVSEAESLWSSFFAAGSALEILDPKARLWTTDRLSQGTTRKQSPPAHPLFEALDVLWAALEARQGGFERWALRLLRQLLSEGPLVLESRKRAARQASFDDLLQRLYAALSGEGGSALASRLRARFPVALIDEFQDTDPVQFAIFKTLYAGVPDTALYLVGDPKQAIYSFRQADMGTYLAARALADTPYGLMNNQRSVPGLIAAVNALFGGHAEAFRQEGLRFYPAGVGEKARGRFLEGEGELPSMVRQAHHERNQALAVRPESPSPACPESPSPACPELPSPACPESPSPVRPESPSPVRPELVEGHSEGDSPALFLHALPSADEAVLDKSGAGQWAIATCVAEISRLLNPQRGFWIESPSSDGEAPRQRQVCAADIAILVRTNRQGQQVKAALRAAGLGAAELSSGSVFETPEADEIRWVMLAMAHPGEAGWVRAALATPLGGLGAEDFVGDFAEMDWRESFRAWGELWARQGIAVALYRLCADLGVVSRLKALPAGERKLTNYRHLIESLQAASHAGEAGSARDPEGLIRWLRAQADLPNKGGEAAQLRLESDAQLIRIVTIHRSKGLEYPIVFCPFAWEGPSQMPGGEFGRAPLAGVDYPLPAGGQCVDWRSEDDPDGVDGKALAEASRAAERVRLLYVALTRAVYRCHVVYGPYRARNSLKESQAAALNGLVAGEAAQTDGWPAIDAAWDALLARCPSIRRVGEEFTLRQAQGERGEETQGERGKVAQGERGGETQGERGGEAQGERGKVAQGERGGENTTIRAQETTTVRAEETTTARAEENTTVRAELVEARLTRHGPTWRMDSFTGLMRGSTPAFSGEESVRGVPDRLLEAGEPPVNERAEDDFLDFARGAQAGECIHAVLEWADFAQEAQWPLAVERALQTHSPLQGEGASARLLRMLKAVLNTPLPGGFELVNVPAADRISELEFCLPVGRLTPERLQAVCAQYGVAVPKLSFPVLRGYLRGFMDLVFRVPAATGEVRYGLLDWKSNYLGDQPTDYAPETLSLAVAEAGYGLQALIYTVALHRHLRQSLPDYRPEIHLGPICVLFVRGMRPDWPAGSGIWAWTPPVGLLDALDVLLGGQA